MSKQQYPGCIISQERKRKPAHRCDECMIGFSLTYDYGKHMQTKHGVTVHDAELDQGEEIITSKISKLIKKEERMRIKTELVKRNNSVAPLYGRGPTPVIEIGRKGIGSATNITHVPRTSYGSVIKVKRPDPIIRIATTGRGSANNITSIPCTSNGSATRVERSGTLIKTENDNVYILKTEPIAKAEPVEIACKPFLIEKQWQQPVQNSGLYTVQQRESTSTYAGEQKPKLAKQHFSCASAPETECELDQQCMLSTCHDEQNLKLVQPPVVNVSQEEPKLKLAQQSVVTKSQEEEKPKLVQQHIVKPSQEQNPKAVQQGMGNASLEEPKLKLVQKHIVNTSKEELKPELVQKQVVNTFKVELNPKLVQKQIVNTTQEEKKTKLVQQHMARSSRKYKKSKSFQQLMKSSREEGERLASDWLVSFFEYGQSDITAIEMYTMYVGACVECSLKEVVDFASLADLMEEMFPNVKLHRFKRDDGQLDVWYNGLRPREDPLPFPSRKGYKCSECCIGFTFQCDYEKHMISDHKASHHDDSKTDAETPSVTHRLAGNSGNDIGTRKEVKQEKDTVVTSPETGGNTTANNENMKKCELVSEEREKSVISVTSKAPDSLEVGTIAQEDKLCETTSTNQTVDVRNSGNYVMQISNQSESTENLCPTETSPEAMQTVSSNHSEHDPDEVLSNEFIVMIEPIYKEETSALSPADRSQETDANMLNTDSAGTDSLVVHERKEISVDIIVEPQKSLVLSSAQLEYPSKDAEGESEFENGSSTR